jgi:hypothetical protein
MFGTFETNIRPVAPVLMTDANDTPHRVTNFGLNLEANDDIAAGIGPAAVDALKHLRSGAQKSSTILLDAVQCVVVFDAGAEDKHTINKVVGVRAVLSRPNAEDAAPTLKLTLSCATRDEDLCWLANHQGPSIKVTITKAQTELPLEGGNGKAKRGKRGAEDGSELPGTERRSS